MKSLEESCEYIKRQTKITPHIGIILGSGLGKYAETISEAISIEYKDIPHFKTPSISGHHGKIVLGKAFEKPVAILSGRIHYYEGHSMSEVVFPVRVLAKLGIKKLIVTNAAGGIHPTFRVGELMAIKDHINLTGDNPLRGPNIPELGERFPDMSEAYSKELLILASRVAYDHCITLHSGVYCALSGPSYETPAEIRMLKTLGADAVGMSTIPEVIAAIHSGIKVLGISCISNLAAGTGPALSHNDVKQSVQIAEQNFTKLLNGILGRM